MERKAVTPCSYYKCIKVSREKGVTYFVVGDVGYGELC